MFYDILDKERKNILPILESLKNDFYLGGGTALALQIGHRDSIDFDFFSEKPFNTQKLFEQLEMIFKDHSIEKTQDEKNTLSIIVDGGIKISFFSYSYPLLRPLIFEEYLSLASIEDIACMKLSAITSRSSMKDYVDLYFILNQKNLGELLDLTKTKFPTLDKNLIIKSLVYFEDIINEPIIFKNNQDISFETIKSFLQKTVENFAK